MNKGLILPLLILMTISLSFAYEPSDYFVELKENIADINHGTTTFTLYNPTDNPLQIDSDKMNFKFLEFKNGVKSYDIFLYVPVDITKTRQINPVETCETDLNNTEQCITTYDSESYVESEVQWVKLQGIYYLQPGQYLDVKMIGNYDKLATGDGILVDWIPEIKDNNYFFGMFYQTLSHNEWAYWNTSWTNYKNITFANNRVTFNDTILHLSINMTDLNVSTNATDIRFIGSDLNTSFSYYRHPLNNSNTFNFDIAFEQPCSNASNCLFYMYYNNRNATDVSNSTFASSISNLKVYFSFSNTNEVNITNHANLSDYGISTAIGNNISGSWGSARNVSSNLNATYFITLNSLLDGRNNNISYFTMQQHPIATYSYWWGGENTNGFYELANHGGCGGNKVLFGGKSSAGWDLCGTYLTHGTSWSGIGRSISNDGTNSEQRIVANGTYNANKTMAGSILGNTTYYIGKTSTAYTEGRGLIDEFQLYYRNMTNSELGLLYDTYNQSFYTFSNESNTTTPSNVTTANASTNYAVIVSPNQAYKTNTNIPVTMTIYGNSTESFNYSFYWTGKSDTATDGTVYVYDEDMSIGSVYTTQATPIDIGTGSIGCLPGEYCIMGGESDPGKIRPIENDTCPKCIVEPPPNNDGKYIPPDDFSPQPSNVSLTFYIKSDIPGTYWGFARITSTQSNETFLSDGISFQVVSDPLVTTATTSTTTDSTWEIVFIYGSMIFICMGFIAMFVFTKGR